MDIDDFERVLRYVGFKCLKFQKIEFEKDALLQIIEEAKDFCSDLNFSISDYLSDIMSAVPLFCKDGQYYRWVHKSLQEYFAAQFIYKDSKTNQDTLLKTLYNSKNFDKYINLLDLYFDIDNWGFKKNILLPICESYIEYYKNNIFPSTVIKKDDIEERIGLLFMREVCILSGDAKEGKMAFSRISDLVKPYLKNESSSITHFHEDNVFIANYSDPRLKLIPQLAKRLPCLFNNKFYRKLTEKGTLSFDEICLLDVHTGEENSNEFSHLNYYLGFNHYNFLFIYDACRKEVDNIKEIIQKKDETSNLIDGL